MGEEKPTTTMNFTINLSDKVYVRDDEGLTKYCTYCKNTVYHNRYK